MPTARNMRGNSALKTTTQSVKTSENGRNGAGVRGGPDSHEAFSRYLAFRTAQS